MEESENGHTKVSDSAYSNSCNSQSQHSGSSRSRHSNSSGSSGYGGHQSSSQSAIADFSVPKRKDKEFKKKKTTKTEVETVTALNSNTPMISTTILETPDVEVTAPIPGAQDSPNLVVPNKTETIISSSKDLRNGVCGSEATGTKPVIDIVELEQEESDSPQMIMLKTSILSQITNSINKKQSVNFEEKKPAQSWNKASFADDVVQNCHHILKDITSSSGKNLNEYPLQSEFSAMVSMLDGVILYTTPNIKDVLGYPRDMWMGRSFIDLVHPEDRSTFASYITSWVALPHEQNKFCTEPKWSPGFLFCRLRQYRGLKGSSGSFGVTERSLTYKPFQLHLALKDVGKGTQLLVTACLVESAFLKKAEENSTSVFATRHDSNTKLTHIDPDAVRFLGFLPHEMLGKSFLDFCHPEDLKEIHKVYEQIMRFENNVTNENPFRLCVQNGSHILVKTEWSGFINPWTHLLEGVTGLHKVIKAPLNPDVFAAVNNEEIFPISEEVLQEANGIREKILNLLTKNVEMPDDVKCDISTRCKTITSEVHNAILVAMTKSTIKVDVTQGQNLSEQDSVMLGEISPHHDYYDSKSSTETPPSYNQLNYNDNIQRFFDSKPKMAPSLSDESGEGKQDLSRSTDEEGKRPQVVSSSSQGSRKCCSPAHCSGGSGSSDRNSNTPTSTGSYKPPQLTEALLCRHNEDMEKWMVQRHREQRSKTDSKSKKYTHVHEKQSQQESALCHGTKRSGSHSWEGEPYKASKHTHNTVQQTHPGECCNNKLKPQPTENLGIGVTTQTPGINLWPPFSVTLTPICTTQTCSSSGNYCMLGCCTGNNGRHVKIPQHLPPSPQLGGMIPFYYVPTAHASLAAAPPPLVPMRSAMVPPQEHPGPPINRAEIPFSQQQVPYVAGMIYHPMVSPLVYPLVGPTTEPAVVEQHHVSLSQQHLHGLGLQTYAETEHPVQDHHSYTLKNPTRNHTSDGTVVTPGQTASTILNGKMQRPASQATSVKAEPGSSVASASVKRDMSESSKKEGYHTSGETEEEGERTDGCQEGESRSSSFYFRRSSTSCSDDISKGTDLTGNQKQDSDNSNTEDMVWEGSENPETREMSKPKLKPPPWLEGVVVNEELILHYKLEKRNLDSVLKHDLNRLQYVSQSQVVNEQLSHLYSELDLMGLGCDLKLEEGEFSWGSTSSSSGGEGEQHESGTKKKQKNLKHMRLGRENDPPAPPCQSAQA